MKQFLLLAGLFLICAGLGAYWVQEQQARHIQTPEVVAEAVSLRDIDGMILAMADNASHWATYYERRAAVADHIARRAEGRQQK